MNNMDKYILEAVGIAGMIFIMVNLFLLETGRESARSKTYLTLGLIGATILTYYSFTLGSITFTVLNFAFILLNGYWLLTLKEKVKKRSKRKKR